MRILVMNGPNMNMLGKREPTLYGAQTLAELEEQLGNIGKESGMEVRFFQSNMEGELVEALQRANDESDGVILNAAAYTHTSVAVRDAVSAISIPVVEVHLTNPQAREEFRRVSMLAGACVGSISGFGVESYVLALMWFARKMRRPE